MAGRSKTATPARAPPSLKKQDSSAGSANQRSIQSFFAKKPSNTTPTPANGVTEASDTSKSVNSSASALPPKKPAFKKSAIKNLTPVPSSDAMGPPSSQENLNGGIPEEVSEADLPSSTTAQRPQVTKTSAMILGSSPSRKVNNRTLLLRYFIH